MNEGRGRCLQVLHLPVSGSESLVGPEAGRTTTAKPKALEPGAYGEAECRRERASGAYSEAGRKRGRRLAGASYTAPNTALTRHAQAYFYPIQCSHAHPHPGPSTCLCSRSPRYVARYPGCRNPWVHTPTHRACYPPHTGLHICDRRPETFSSSLTRSPGARAFRRRRVLFLSTFRGRFRKVDRTKRATLI